MWVCHCELQERCFTLEVISDLEFKIKKNVCRWWVGRRLVPMTTVVKCEPNVVISVVFWSLWGSEGGPWGDGWAMCPPGG